MKECCEFGVGVILLTQSVSHFDGGDDDYSCYVLTRVVHKANDLKQRQAENVFKFWSKTPEIVKSCAKAEYYGSMNTLRILISIWGKAFWKLYNEISRNL